MCLLLISKHCLELFNHKWKIFQNAGLPLHFWNELTIRRVERPLHHHPASLGCICYSMRWLPHNMIRWHFGFNQSTRLQKNGYTRPWKGLSSSQWIAVPVDGYISKFEWIGLVPPGYTLQIWLSVTTIW